jgi:hypothetical protein
MMERQKMFSTGFKNPSTHVSRGLAATASSDLKSSR